MSCGQVRDVLRSCAVSLGVDPACQRQPVARGTQAVELSTRVVPSTPSIGWQRRSGSRASREQGGLLWSSLAIVGKGRLVTNKKNNWKKVVASELDLWLNKETRQKIALLASQVLEPHKDWTNESRLPLARHDRRWSLRRPLLPDAGFTEISSDRYRLRFLSLISFPPCPHRPAAMPRPCFFTQDTPRPVTRVLFRTTGRCPGALRCLSYILVGT